MNRHREKTAIYKPRRETFPHSSQKEPTLLVDLDSGLDFGLLASGIVEAINFYCFKPPSLWCFLTVTLAN